MLNISRDEMETMLLSPNQYASENVWCYSKDEKKWDVFMKGEIPKGYLIAPYKENCANEAAFLLIDKLNEQEEKIPSVLLGKRYKGWFKDLRNLGLTDLYTECEKEAYKELLINWFKRY